MYTISRSYYIRWMFFLCAFATSQLIVLLAYRFLQNSTVDLLFPRPECSESLIPSQQLIVTPIPSQQVIVTPAASLPAALPAEVPMNEKQVKEGIALDAQNEASIQDNFNAKNENNSAIVFIDELEENKVYYQLDYTKSHPFENECRFPVLIHNDPDLSKHAGHYREIDCSKVQKYPPLVNQYRNGEILIGRPHRASIQSFECSYIEISGALTPNKKKVQLVGSWKKLPLSRRILIQKDQFVIKCYSKKVEVYHNVFAWVSDKPRLSPPPVNVPNKYSVAMLIIDSTSRNQFYRHMPLTLKFMKERDFQILHGYTKIGDNSAVNLLSILSGLIYQKEGRGFANLVENDGVFDFKKYQKDFQQLPDSIIAKAKKAGCATMWNDEIANSGYGLYHYYDFNGFHKPIADYYYRPFYEYQYQSLTASKACNNGEAIIPKWLQLWEQFSTKFVNHCHFSFNFFTGLTHASSNNLELYDIPVSEALGRMEAAGVMENTFLLIMGDHGQRISPIQKTYIGRIEERMSMMGIHVPRKFRDEFPDKFNNMVINKNRLTSNFDIHETLEDIYGLTLETTHEDRVKHGISLFEEIPKNRSCVDALIPENFCCCMEVVNEPKMKDAEPLIKPKLDSYFDSIFGHSCVSNYSYTIDPYRTAYTISKQSRYGARFIKVWQDVIPAAKAKVTREIIEIELEVALNVEANAQNVQGTLKVRLQYNTALKKLQLNASPLLSLPECSDIFIVDEICGCLNK